MLTPSCPRLHPLVPSPCTRRRLPTEQQGQPRLQAPSLALPCSRALWWLGCPGVSSWLSSSDRSPGAQEQPVPAWARARSFFRLACWPTWEKDGPEDHLTLSLASRPAAGAAWPGGESWDTHPTQPGSSPGFLAILWWRALRKWGLGNPMLVVVPQGGPQGFPCP